MVAGLSRKTAVAAPIVRGSDPVKQLLHGWKNELFRPCLWLAFQGGGRQKCPKETTVLPQKSPRQSMAFETGSGVDPFLHWIFVSCQKSSAETYLNAKYFSANFFKIKPAKGVERGEIGPQSWASNGMLGAEVTWLRALYSGNGVTKGLQPGGVGGVEKVSDEELSKQVDDPSGKIYDGKT
ncbi:unnamed protein product [Taenia asiatica]|uniref:Villin-1 n=1 Tax=Taenia asiatica TaxID=60517 RepID=A0A0R3W5N5_TAEAS|nr:unnamed protein product [Taenia asiatica]